MLMGFEVRAPLEGWARLGKRGVGRMLREGFAVEVSTADI